MSDQDRDFSPRQVTAIGRARWREIVLQSLIDLWKNNVMEWAAAISLYAMLSFFPLLLAAVAVSSFFVDPAWAARWLTGLSDLLLPSDLFNTTEIVTAAVTEQRSISLIGIVAWILGGRRIIGVLVTALDRVSDVDLRQETVHRRLSVEAVMLVGVALLFLTTIIAMPVVTRWWAPVIPFIQFLILVSGVAVTYAIVPRGRRAWTAVLIAAVATSVLLLIAREIFRRTIGLFWPGFSIAYGPLAIAVALLLWGWIAGIIVLAGGSLASHIKVMAVQGHDRAEAARRHVEQRAEDD